MFVKTILLKQFRCFDHLKLDFKSPIVFIEGANGTGKTSIIEAFNYLSYLRSFRASTTKDLIRDGSTDFFVKILLQGNLNNQDDLEHELSAGFSQKKRVVKIDKKAIKSYKELTDHFRAITVTEENLGLINGGPEYRRSFIDQTLFLINPSIISLMKSFRNILENRNMLLRQSHCLQELYEIWTHQLWEISRSIAIKRYAALLELKKDINDLLLSCKGYHHEVEFSYKSKSNLLDTDYGTFRTNNPTLYHDETRVGRSTFGAHLDDILIDFDNKKSRVFASRGQQKFLVALMKIAQVGYVKRLKGPVLFLLDDFMTDFDQKNLEIILSMLKNSDAQLIFTFPIGQKIFKKGLLKHGAQAILLTA